MSRNKKDIWRLFISWVVIFYLGTLAGRAGSKIEWFSTPYNRCVNTTAIRADVEGFKRCLLISDMYYEDNRNE